MALINSEKAETIKAETERANLEALPELEGKYKSIISKTVDGEGEAKDGRH